ncbi:MAG: hypothetical protein ACOZNI_24660 [Myxococcota bacterium]
MSQSPLWFRCAVGLLVAEVAIATAALFSVLFVHAVASLPWLTMGLVALGES